MLILTRKIGESIIVGNDASITVVGIKDNHIRLGVHAPVCASVIVNKHELQLKIIGEKKLSKGTHFYKNNKVSQPLNQQ